MKVEELKAQAYDVYMEIARLQSNIKDMGQTLQKLTNEIQDQEKANAGNNKE